MVSDVLMRRRLCSSILNRLALLIFTATVTLSLRVVPIVSAWKLQPPQGLSRDKILALAQKRYPKTTATDANHLPMYQKVCVVTGAAGGIGRELCTVLHSLGATVVAMDRNIDGLEELEQVLSKSGNNDNEHRIWTLPTNHEDLRSVADSADQILEKYPEIDLLINNAGLSYPISAHDFVPGNPRMVSKHGNDLAFTVNFLSHFLLTEKLLTSLSKNDGRIVHITSTFHWKVDGSELLPSDGQPPLAYQTDPSKMSPKHIERSYANTKLAQIWHSRSIKQCASVCACPTWAATGIAGDDGRTFLERFAFGVENCGPGITSAINAILRTEEELQPALNDHGSCFVANSRILERSPVKWISSDLINNKLQWRDVMSTIFAVVFLLGQRFTHEDFILQETSPESLDKEKQELFYEWSLKELQPWL